MTARLHVDLDALVANIARVRATASPAELMLVVKDDAYGHGLEPVVQTASRTAQPVRTSKAPNQLTPAAAAVCTTGSRPWP